ncbi:hypothetical protein J1P26_11760 [Neobacillus sp. MM2021_6]|uniref:hypothetical protein n=1 Tax=Bacillaceae TaxID=186817 RepID=UPI00140C67E9|nr:MULTISPECIES: hypothetical protein [Bacillaceae]MBO0960380.1 hypothetical protein [Neobacillus sp. MM2021_6]NHC16763.1 hypothetical protein [Bacillus sp. MM2020_4]WML38896.1 hypothetical protein RCG19_17105 [Neobacillus sp. OS1-2]
MKTPNYHDFYEKALIPIGLNDQNSLDENHPDSTSTHWLIAVEGVQLPQPKIFYHWKVSVYPADGDGDFNWKKPYYCSTNMKLMDDAMALASTLASASKNDELTTVTLLEKIS